jgi:hypothetical protein
MTTQIDLNDPQSSRPNDSAAEIVRRRSELLQRAQQLSQPMDRRVREIIGRPATASTPPADR